MSILVDADSFPGKDIVEKAAKDNDIKVIMFCDVNHLLTSDYSIIKYIDSGFQSVDMAIINNVKKNDIVITQDFGVAAMVLSKKAYVINPKGYVYSNDNIDRLLFERHISLKERKKGRHINSCKKRNKKDNERLYKNLLKLIKICNNVQI